MENHLIGIAAIIMILPLLGALIAGFFGHLIGRRASHFVTIGLVGISFFLSCYVFAVIVIMQHPVEEGVLYSWVTSGAYQFDVAILLDQLSAMMITVVTFVSFMVHIYTVGYMADDPGYQRFFSYVSLFTFAMLALVLANNFLLMFFWLGRRWACFLLTHRFLVSAGIGCFW